MEGGSDELCKLRVRKISVTVGLHKSHDSEELSLRGVVATRSEEATLVECVDPAVILAVNAAVGGKGRVVEPDLYLTLENVKAALETNFLLENVEKAAFHII